MKLSSGVVAACGASDRGRFRDLCLCVLARDRFWGRGIVGQDPAKSPVSPFRGRVQLCRFFRQRPVTDASEQIGRKGNSGGPEFFFSVFFFAVFSLPLGGSSPGSRKAAGQFVQRIGFHSLERQEIEAEF